MLDLGGGISLVWSVDDTSNDVSCNGEDVVCGGDTTTAAGVEVIAGAGSSLDGLGSRCILLRRSSLPFWLTIYDRGLSVKAFVSTAGSHVFPLRIRTLSPALSGGSSLVPWSK